jgi:hypothetical protein
VESGDAQGAPHLVCGNDPYYYAVPCEANTPFFGGHTNMGALALFPWKWLELVKMNLTTQPSPTWYTEPDPPSPLWPN